jgi:hypothetical protein
MEDESIVMRFASNVEVKFNKAKEPLLDTFKLLASLNGLRIPNSQSHIQQ